MRLAASCYALSVLAHTGIAAWMYHTPVRTTTRASNERSTDASDGERRPVQLTVMLAMADFAPPNSAFEPAGAAPTEAPPRRPLAPPLPALPPSVAPPPSSSPNNTGIGADRATAPLVMTAPPVHALDFARPEPTDQRPADGLPPSGDSVAPNRVAERPAAEQDDGSAAAVVVTPPQPSDQGADPTAEPVHDATKPDQLARTDAEPTLAPPNKPGGSQAQPQEPQQLPDSAPPSVTAQPATTADDNDNTAHTEAFDEDSVDRPITFEKMTRPMPSAVSRRLGESGTVVILIEVDRDGTLLGHEVIDDAGTPRLLNAALDALGQSTFTPAERGGEPVRSTRRIEYRF